MMRKLLICVLLFACFTTGVSAESYCVMSGNDGSVTEEKDMHKTQSVASISKIMTAIIAIEQGNLEDTWKVSDAILQAEGSSVYLKVGDQVSLKTLLYGLMLRSGNDAAQEIAVHISEDVDRFVALMNEKAKEIGMKDTVFHNPSGLDERDGGNISSAYDMALLMRYAMKNPTFAQIVKTQYYDTEQKVRWKNKNKLLFQNESITGGKTGFTKQAGRTLVSTAEANEMESIVVTLRMGNDFEFHETKHDAFRNEHTSYIIMKEGTYHCGSYIFEIPESLRVTIANDGSDQLAVHSRIHDDNLIIEVIKNQESTTYEYEGIKASSKKGGLFS